MVPLGLLMLLASLIRSKPQAADPYIYMGGLVFLVVGGAVLCELLRTLDELTFLRVLFPMSGQTVDAR
jgi:hypothetical protein